MVAQTRHVEAGTGAVTTLGRVSIGTAMERAVNVHGLRVEVNIESEAMEANANGHWAVYAFPGNVITSIDQLEGWGDFNNEQVTQYLWGVGLWMASNQTPFHTVFKPMTTRNLPKGGRVVSTVWVEGTLPVLTNNRVNILHQFFTSQ